MKKSLLKFLLFPLLTLPVNVWGITISGTVVDKKGEPLPGAAVVVTESLTTGTPVGTTTDIDGNFTLADIQQNSQIKISYITYEDKTFSASELTNETIILQEEENENLDASIIIDTSIDCNSNEIKQKLNAEKTALYKCQGKNDPKCLYTDTDGQPHYGQTKCIPAECKPTHKLNNDQCISKNGDPCDRKDLPQNANSGTYECNTTTCVCKVNANDCVSGYTPDISGEDCISTICNNCEIFSSNTKQCEPNQQLATSCATPDNGATTATWQCENNTLQCVITLCDTKLYEANPNKNGQCVSLNGQDCKITNADSATYVCTNTECDCTVSACKSGFDNVNNTCQSTQCPCLQKWDSTQKTCIALTENEKNCTSSKQNLGATKAEYTCDSNGKQICTITECNPNEYEDTPKDNKCVRKSDKCDSEPAHSKKSHRQWDEDKKQDICIIDECVKGYHKNGDKCDPDKTYTQEEIAELEAKTKTAKDTEQSLKNRLLGGVTMAATGIGGMELARGLAEQSTDKVANDDMTAYLATFKCEYGTNKANGGDAENELPGANTLFALYNEYQQLASDLKGTKEALGMTPGIESQVVLDKAATGLYDDMATGKTNGTFASLSRAINDSESADAAQIADEQSKSKSRVTGGAIAAGAGVAAGVAGNVLLNKVDWNAKKDKESPKQ